ncbi:MAG: beta-lactamase family protein [Paludibacter sp.]|nr:beta-lactamase family protein [Bacteroidales bacterium]MCM1068782.1 beta-lactamase family protein [Prevotella sp.]MCM1353923.1 beta-lactamase family protein [Bacteroides sp.]MCM1443321.1 beta-lactamase family protein [Muribaculum sp.]MCM1482138.1 beta-lactamase family protein [Paludibacter sp.]
MKRYALLACLLTALLPVAAQTYNEQSSNPITMGWMQGFPPASNRILSASDGSFFLFPALRYTVCHMREFVPTKVVTAANERRYTLKCKYDKGINDICFIPLFAEKSVTLQQALDTIFTDGFIVLHKGKVVYERYSGGLTPDGTHSVMSVSKTMTGTLGAVLVAEGILDENERVDTYVPELAESAFGDATVRQLLDMTTALQYSEDYSDPNAEVWAFSASGTPCHPADDQGTDNYYAYLQTVRKNGEHGQRFAYKTINTDALGWVISRVTGKSIPDLLSERIWQPMGANHDGYYQVDSYGIAFAGGGFNANLRDLALFAEMIRREGKWNGKQIIPTSVVEDIMQNADNARFDEDTYPNLKGWGYRNMWWVTNNAHRAFCARGVYGQVIYVDPLAEMVIVRLASNTVASNAANDPFSLPLYEAIADYLMSK